VEIGEKHLRCEEARMDFYGGCWYLKMLGLYYQQSVDEFFIVRIAAAAT